MVNMIGYKVKISTLTTGRAVVVEGFLCINITVNMISTLQIQYLHERTLGRK